MSGILPRVRGRAGAPDTARFNQLPRNQPRDSQNQFAHPCNQRERESGVTRNSEQITNDHVAALLHAEGARHWKHCRTNRQNHALKDHRVDERRLQTKCVKRDPDFA